MRKNPIRAFFACLILTLCFCLQSALAGGVFKEKIQNKLNSSNNQPILQYDYNNEQEGKKDSYKHDRDQQLGKKEIVDDRSRKVEVDIVSSSEVNQVAYSPKPQESLFPVAAGYIVYRTEYNTELEDNVVSISGNVLFDVFKPGWTRIPVCSTSVGLIEVKLNRSPSLVINQDGKYYCMVNKPGRYSLDMEFLVKAARERENGPGSFEFEVIPAPISQFEMRMPEEDLDIFVEPSIRLEIKKENKQTVAWAVMPNTNKVSVRWAKALPKETIAPVKLEPKIYADTATYASIGEGLVRAQTKIKYSILQSEVSSFRLALPDDVGVLDVQGKDLRDWKVSKEQGVQYADVYLNFGVKGSYNLNIIYERNIGIGSTVASMPWVKVVGAERETGFFGVAASTNVELAVNKADNVTSIDVKELPSDIWSSSNSPILLAFKYLNHPVNIAIDVTKHEELPVLVTAIDSVDYMTLYTDEGKVLTKAVFQIRNNVKQFIHLNLPKNAVLWSAFVSGRPAKPAKDKNGDILVPLEKSQLSGDSLTQFPVEIVYLDSASKVGFFGNFKLHLPKTDIPISSLFWSLYLPKDYRYFAFGGDVKLERNQAQGYIMHKSQRSGSYAVGSNFVSQQMVQDEQFQEELQQAQVKGALPIRIDVPQLGRSYRFSKLLITEKESPYVSAYFMYGFYTLLNWVKLFIVLGGLAFIIRKIANRKKQKAG
ncbi:MAG: hypothetical protein MUF05_00600 [Candidatus Omnitrophica bacterium]|jgi:hypothetical protein|nr:hypothetical protein [Candidatus Omnitrophota bacterium]